MRTMKTSPIWANLLSLFFPKTCLVCARPLADDEERICASCLCDLPYTRSHQKADSAVERLFIGKAPIDRAAAFFVYEKGSPIQRVIHALKYHDDPEIGVYLGRMAAKAILRESAFFEGVDLLLPVPLHRQRLRKRGYNQAERIAQGIHEITNLPVDTTSVIRHVGNESQTHKQVYERMANVCSIFKLVSSENLIGKHILLVDDVITTGSTLSSLSQVLLEIEGIKISVFALSSV